MERSIFHSCSAKFGWPHYDQQQCLIGALCCSTALANSEKVPRRIQHTNSRSCLLYGSKVVLGYIQNETKRFYVYVANRVQIIRSVSDPSQWRYINTNNNPADIATRGSNVDKLKDSIWLRGPKFLEEPNSPVLTPLEEFCADAADPDVRVTTCSTSIHPQTGLRSDQFAHFSKFVILCCALANLIVKVKEFKGRRCRTIEGGDTSLWITQQSAGTRRIQPPHHLSVEDLVSAETVKITTVQKECFLDGINLLQNLECSHEKETVRSSGHWITGAHKMVSKLIDSCVLCKSMRSPNLTQHMSDLLVDRTETPPPFTNVCCDVFGPWTILMMKTGGGSTDLKRWGLVFTCLNC